MTVNRGCTIKLQIRWLLISNRIFKTSYHIIGYRKFSKVGWFGPCSSHGGGFLINSRAHWFFMMIMMEIMILNIITYILLLSTSHNQIFMSANYKFSLIVFMCILYFTGFSQHKTKTKASNNWLDSISGNRILEKLGQFDSAVLLIRAGGYSSPIILAGFELKGGAIYEVSTYLTYDKTKHFSCDSFSKTLVTSLSKADSIKINFQQLEKTQNNPASGIRCMDCYSYTVIITRPDGFFHGSVIDEDSMYLKDRILDSIYVAKMLANVDLTNYPLPPIRADFATLNELIETRYAEWKALQMNKK